MARGIYARWHRLAAGERRRLQPLAEDVRRRALDLRGHTDPEPAGRDLKAANERLAGAMVQSAEADPEVSEAEVKRLKDELERELERLASGEVAASRKTRRPPRRPHSPASPAAAQLGFTTRPPGKRP